MNDLRDLEADLRSKPPIDRELAARALAAAGTTGHTVLRAVALDGAAAQAARVTAIQLFPDTGAPEDTLRSLLADPAAVIRLVALHKVEAAKLKGLDAAVAALTDDAEVVWDLDEIHVIAKTAARVLATLRA